ncbi:MAG TPA: hypothetical protein VF587_18830 [Solirubrobacteraceae bacterium]
MRNGLLVAVGLATLTLASPASAADVKVVDGDMVYTAAPGEANELTIMLQGGRITIQDGTVGFAATQPVTPAPPCEPQSSGWVGDMIDAYCPADVRRFVIDVGDGTDYVSVGAMTTTPYPTVVTLGDSGDRLWGGPSADEVDAGDGDDTITPNAGRDTIAAGAGDDTIEAVDGFPDDIDCGEGYDLVDADDVDSVEGCENVRTGSPTQLPLPPAPEPPAAPEPPVVEPAAGVAPPRIVDVITRWPTRARLARLGIVARVLCGADCYMTSELRLRGRVIGEGRSVGSAGQIASIRTRLVPGAMRRLRALRRPRLTLRLANTSGGRTTILSRRIWLSVSR